MPTKLRFTVVAGKDLGEKLTATDAEARLAIARTVRAAQLDLQNAMKRNIKKTFHQHTGDFRRSIAIEPITVSGPNITGPVGTNLEFAEIQEEGGEIHAKRARNLTIPLEAFLTGKGSAKGSAHDVIAAPGNYGYDGTFFSKGVLFGKKGDQVDPLFALKPSVTLPARPYAQPALDEVGPVFEQRLESALEALL